MKKRAFSLLLALLMCLALFPNAALAEGKTEPPASKDTGTAAPNPEGVPVTQIQVEPETVVSVDGEDDNDALFEGYLESTVFSTAPKKRDGFTVNPRLSGNDAAVYSALRRQIEAVAAGESSSTVFEVKPEDFGHDSIYWYEEDLGTPIVAGNTISEAAQQALWAKYDFSFSLVMDALLSDCSYSLYWYKKTAGAGVNYSGYLTPEYDQQAKAYYLYLDGAFVFSFSVAEDYSAGDYTVDVSKVNLAKAAAQNAKDFVTRCAEMTDAQKLLAYKDEICRLVTYNDDAANGLVLGTNPWQLVWVFDGDTTTNVVCEGYAKAFKYLCDLSSFSSFVKCITVSGPMDGGTGAGPHMWNIVSLEDGNYLVDVTNCDEDSIGYPDRLFMNADATGSVEEGYVFDLGYASIAYAYDEDTTGLYDSAELSIGRVEQDDAALIQSAQASLDGTLAIRFTFTVPESISVTGAYALFSGSGRTLAIPFAQAAEVSGSDYSFDYRLAAKEYRDTVNVKLFDADGNPIPLRGASGTDYTESGLNYSLETYVTKMKAREDLSDAMRSLAEGIEAYCTAAQLYFGYNTAGLALNNAVSQVTAAQLEGFKGVFSGSLPEGVTDRAIQLELESDTMLRLIVYTDSSVAPEDYSFTVNGARVYPERNADGSYYLDVTGIAAADLDSVQTFGIACHGVTYTVSASAMSYARSSVLNGNEARQNLGRALFLYNSAANDYFGR